MREFLQRYIFTRSFGEHIFSFLGIIVIFWIGKDFVVFFITAFLCGYLFQSISRWFIKGLQKTHQTGPMLWRSFIKRLSREKVMITLSYIVFAIICIIAIRDIGPKLSRDMIALFQTVSERYGIDAGTTGLVASLNQWQSISDQASELLRAFTPEAGAETIFSQFFQIGKVFFQIIVAYIISYVWLMEYDKVQPYFAQLKSGPFAFFYHDLKMIFEKITQSFGLVFQAQSQIALANTLLTMLGLFFIGIIYGQIFPGTPWIFPYFGALAFITFLTSFIPILGVFVGGIPMVFAGFSAYPGWSIIIAIVIMLLVIHTIEGYFLNPKLVGKTLNIPAPVIFLILFVSEHFMGIAGFFLGVPIYLLLLEFIDMLGTKINNIKQP